MELAKEILEGNRRSIARAISCVENEDSSSQELISEIYPHTGSAHVVGITGPSGAGKSTIVEKLALRLRDQGLKIGIIAIDPTSPFTGGALLGDRIRMRGLSKDKDIFVRSMGSRGNPGGISRKTRDAVRILDASGKDVILVETVGAGQSEVAVKEIVHTLIVIEVPGLGDDVQSIKAGIFEIGDIFVVNKADMIGADGLLNELTIMLSIGDKRDWEPPVLSCTAIENKGVSMVVDAIHRHWDHLENSGKLVEKNAEQVRSELLELVERTFLSQKMETFDWKEFERMVLMVGRKEIDPYRGAQHLVDLK